MLPLEALQLEIDLARYRVQSDVLRRHVGERFTSSATCPQCGTSPVTLTIALQPLRLVSECCHLPPQPEPLA